MVKVEIFGIGCPKCKQTMKNSTEALRQLEIEGSPSLVKDQVEIMKRGVTSTPALAINGSVKVMGRIPEVKEIINWLSATK